MVQLLPASLSEDEVSQAQRLRDLARVLPPADVQLYYQTLLMGRKDLPLAPDRRLGVEMTLLRALAFHPQALIAEPVARPVLTPQATPAPAPVIAAQPQMAPPQTEVPPIPADYPDMAPAPENLSDATSQLLQARTQLLRQGASKAKKSEPAARSARPANTALERLANVTERVQQRTTEPAVKAAAKPEAYRWKAQTPTEVVAEPVATPKALRSALEHEKTPELAQRLAEEAQQRDAWAAEIAALSLPKLVQQLALNAWKEQGDNQVCLHLRSSQRHLNSGAARQALAEALSHAAGQTVELTIIEDDNSAVLTPLEWRQAIYEEKLSQARQSIISDTHIQTLRRFFDADLDEESIRPV
jgi:DNA polymerase-3 subunit gamma/tau